MSGPTAYKMAQQVVFKREIHVHSSLWRIAKVYCRESIGQSCLA